MKGNEANYFLFTVSLRILRDLSEVMGTSGFYATRKKVYILELVIFRMYIIMRWNLFKVG